MLVRTRTPDAGDRSVITIGADIQITVVSANGDSVRIGISAPADVIVDRKEIWLEKREQAV